MTIRCTFFHWLFFAATALLLACQHPVSSRERNMLTYFPAHPPGDTLHMEIVTEIDTAPGPRIPSSLFFKQVPAALREEIDYLADPEQALIYGRQQFPLVDSITACWVEIRQYWFQHHLLLLYNKRKKAFTGGIAIAEWYGGESGQVLTGSWLFDFDGDGRKDIVRQQIDHYTEMKGEEWTEHIQQSATLLLWKNGHFLETPLADTAAMIGRYPIRHFW